MHNTFKFDKLPQPLTISKKLNLRTAFDQTNPYRLGEQIKQNRLSTSRRHSGLAEMKQQLMQIKDDMIKLFTPSQEDVMEVISTPDILHEALKQELAQYKVGQQKLKKEIQKNKSDYNKSISQIQSSTEAKVQQLKKEKDTLKTKYQKTIELKTNQIDSLKQQLINNEDNFKKQFNLQKSKYESLNTELVALQNTIRQLKSGNSKQQQLIIEGIEMKKHNIQLTTQLKSLIIELQNYKAINLKLNQQVKQSSIRFAEARDSVSILESNQMSLLERLRETEEQGQLNHQTNNQQLNSQRMQIINLQLTVNDLQEQNYVLTEHNKHVKNILVQTEDYIKALEAELNNYISVSKDEYRRGKGI